MQQAVGTEPNHVEKRQAERLFNRDLPGGGYVAIELADRSGSRRVRVLVERRSDRARRHGHAPPIILDEEWKPERGFGELYRIACDNVAIARALLKLQRVD